MQKIKTAIQEYLRHTDLLLLGIAVLTSLLSLLPIYSATRPMGGNVNKFLIVQGMAILVGIVGFIIVSVIDLTRIGPYWKVLFVLNLLFQASLFVLGTGEAETGNNSWIRFAGIGVQPAEVGKIIFVFTLSQHIQQLRDKINRPLSVLQLLLHLLLTVGMVFASSKDLGMAITYLLIFVIMLFASGIALRWLLALALCVVVAVPVLWPRLGEYQQMRILVVFEPEISPKYSYHAQQSQIAIGSGQLFGQGLLGGRQTQSRRLPTGHTDFIFAVIGEEFGFIGACLVLVLLSAIVLRIFYDGGKTGGGAGQLICSGIGGMIMVQTLINVGMCTGIMPVIGLTLPFVSYGGTSVATMFVALGLVSGVLMRQKPSWLR